jgi:hypothetical protein
MYLELWEAGLGALAEHGEDDGGLADWLAALYRVPAPPATLFESWLHDPAGSAPPRRSRGDLGWWAFLAMPRALEGDADAWRPESTLLESQGLAVLRADGPAGLRYAALECGSYGGGHGHPDRLNLTAHDGRTYWLPDMGTGSYVARDLFWYRSTLAHNAPRLDGRSQPVGDAVCEAFDARDGWSWVRGSYGAARRTLVSGPAGLLDVLEVADEGPRLVDLPWHFPPETRLVSAGRWEAAALDDVDPVVAEFVRESRRFVPEAAGRLRFEGPGLTVVVAAPPAAELWCALAPGAPGEPEPRPFWFLRHRERMTRVVTAMLAGEDAMGEVGLTVEGETTALDAGGRRVGHRVTTEGWVVETPEGEVHLAGLRPPAREPAPLFSTDRALRTEGEAPPLHEAPALDGTLRGFDLSAPLALDHEDQYRRSETPYEGAEAFAATAWVNWADDVLYLAVDVVKPELVLRPADAPPLRLDNEPDAIHGDGLQVYVRHPGGGPVAGLLLAPDPAGDGLLVRPVAETVGDEVAVRGGWRPTATGYAVTAALALRDWPLEPGAELGFDLVVNEMRPGRRRRAGQLVWSGGGGWVWLRGDRQDPARFGALRLEGAR